MPSQRLFSRTLRVDRVLKSFVCSLTVVITIINESTRYICHWQDYSIPYGDHLLKQLISESNWPVNLKLQVAQCGKDSLKWKRLLSANQQPLREMGICSFRYLNTLISEAAQV